MNRRVYQARTGSPTVEDDARTVGPGAVSRRRSLVPALLLGCLGGFPHPDAHAGARAALPPTQGPRAHLPTLGVQTPAPDVPAAVVPDPVYFTRPGVLARPGMVLPPALALHPDTGIGLSPDIAQQTMFLHMRARMLLEAPRPPRLAFLTQTTDIGFVFAPDISQRLHVDIGPPLRTARAPVWPRLGAAGFDLEPAAAAVDSEAFARWILPVWRGQVHAGILARNFGHELTLPAPSLPADWTVGLAADGTNVYVRTTADLSAFEGYVLLEYTR